MAAPLGYFSSVSQTGNFFLIQQLSPSAVSTVTFSSIPATYKSLQVRFNLVTSASSTYFGLQMNGDTGANYAFHQLAGNGAAAYAGGGATQNYGVINPALTVTTYPNVGIVDILDYANTNKNKTVKSIAGSNNNTSAGCIAIESDVWLSTAAITSLTLFIGSGTFTGTVTLIGIS